MFEILLSLMRRHPFQDLRWRTDVRALGCGQSGACGHAPATPPTIAVTDSATGLPAGN
jgi:hypothetical protein